MAIFIPHPFPHPHLGNAAFGEPERDVERQEVPLFGQDGSGDFLLPPVVLLHDLAGRVLGPEHDLRLRPVLGEPEGDRRLPQVLKAEGLHAVAARVQVGAHVLVHPARHQVEPDALGQLEHLVGLELGENEVFRFGSAAELLQRRRHTRRQVPLAAVGVVLALADRDDAVGKVDVAVAQPQDVSGSQPLAHVHPVEHAAPHGQLRIGEQLGVIVGVQDGVARRRRDGRQPALERQWVLLHRDDAARRQRPLTHGLDDLVVVAQRGRGLHLLADLVGGNRFAALGLGQASHGDVSDDSVDVGQTGHVGAGGRRVLPQGVLVGGVARVFGQLVLGPLQRERLERGHAGSGLGCRLVLAHVAHGKASRERCLLGVRRLGHFTQQVVNFLVVTQGQQLVPQVLQVALALLELRHRQGGGRHALEAHVAADAHADEMTTLAHGLLFQSAHQRLVGCVFVDRARLLAPSQAQLPHQRPLFGVGARAQPVAAPDLLGVFLSLAQPSAYGGAVAFAPERALVLVNPVVSVVLRGLGLLEDALDGALQVPRLFARFTQLLNKLALGHAYSALPVWPILGHWGPTRGRRREYARAGRNCHHVTRLVLHFFRV